MNYVDYECRCPDLGNDWEIERHFDAGYAAECYARDLCEADTELNAPECPDVAYGLLFVLWGEALQHYCAA